jgi:phosphoglucosamine mutase
VGSIFGTDGVRGVANVDLTPELADALGRALVTVLHEEGDDPAVGPRRP